MRNMFSVLLLLLACSSFAQHDNHHSAAPATNHLSHLQACRGQTVYIHNLPPPILMQGIGSSVLKIQTTSDSTQLYFNQGISLLHDFWDLEAYRAFKEAIRHDSTALMPYWGLLQSVGPEEDTIYAQNKALALRQLKKLVKNASDREKLYAESVLLRDSLKDEAGQKAYHKKLEQLVQKYPEDVEAKLFLAISVMSGFDSDMNPREGQVYSEYLLRDLLRTHPKHHGVHHYWIHLMENCCPEQALESANVLTALAPSSGHIVHMPGHVYYKLGDYKRAYDAFIAAVRVDSAYMKNQGVKEVDDWNYIHNINYLLANCAQDGRHSEGMYYAQKLKDMATTKDRQKIYQRVFFNQGKLAPAKMQMAFGFWDKAALELDLIKDVDSVYSPKGMAYKEGLSLFAKGMDAASKNKLQNAVMYSNALDALLWRNANQAGKDTVIGKFLQNNLNAASLELQGCIKTLQGDFAEGLWLLEQAKKKEKELGYGEPPYYARPVAMSIAAANEMQGKWDNAIAAYHEVLSHHPHSSYAYHGLAVAYRKKGDLAKAAEYESKTKEASRYGDKWLYPFSKRQ